MGVTVDREIAAARDLLERYRTTYTTPDDGPVPVDDIAESYLGLLVTFAALEDGVSGMLLLREREIRINALECELWPRRRRFTVAHEIGHWELHATEVETDFICRLGDVREGQEKGSPEQLREREANRFAAELLMPEERVQASVEAHGTDVAAQAERFDVSALSMAWRLYNLGYLTRRPKPTDYDAA
jgi:predicted transcriptional regulator